MAGQAAHLLALLPWSAMVGPGNPRQPPLAEGCSVFRGGKEEVWWTQGGLKQTVVLTKHPICFCASQPLCLLDGAG